MIFQQENCKETNIKKITRTQVVGVWSGVKIISPQVVINLPIKETMIFLE
jgi:hypothetical protein